MYKLKTTKSVSKRFRVSSNGKFLRHYSCKSHLLQKKSSSRKRKLRRKIVIDYCDHYSLNYTLPYI